MNEPRPGECWTNFADLELWRVVSVTATTIEARRAYEAVGGTILWDRPQAFPLHDFVTKHKLVSAPMRLT
jgi:hypothetical protein